MTAGFSKHFGLALIANYWNPNKTLEECQSIIRNCFSVLFMRDCHSSDRIQMATVNKNGIKILDA
jgi:hypothetical protein